MSSYWRIKLDILSDPGHKSERSFLKYIRVSKLDTARRFNEHIKKKWGERVLSKNIIELIKGETPFTK